MEAPPASLPDDVILEILARVRDAATLFRSATVCKRWSRIVADRSLVPGRLLAGFFAQQRHRGRLPTPWFTPALLGSRRRALRSFVPGVAARLFDYALPLASRHGLLLVRLNQHGVDVNRQNPILLATCNPLAGTVRELPPLVSSPGINDMTGYAMLTAEDCPSSDNIHGRQQQRSAFFKVMVVSATVRNKKMDYVIHTFSSSGESGWHSHSSSLDTHVRATLQQHNAVVCGGTVHWLLRGVSSGTYTLDVSIDTGHVSFSNAISPAIVLDALTYDDPYLTVDTQAGKLAVLCLQKDGRQLHIWASDGNGQWPFHTSIRRYPGGTGRLYRCLGEKNGTMLVIDSLWCVYVTHVMSWAMEEVTKCPHLRRENTVLFDLDWPDFLATRLRAAATR